MPGSGGRGWLVPVGGEEVGRECEKGEYDANTVYISV
jgi:hypothetical protein